MIWMIIVNNKITIDVIGLNHDIFEWFQEMIHFPRKALNKKNQEMWIVNVKNYTQGVNVVKCRYRSFYTFKKINYQTPQISKNNQTINN